MTKTEQALSFESNVSEIGKDVKDNKLYELNTVLNKVQSDSKEDLLPSVSENKEKLSVKEKQNAINAPTESICIEKENDDNASYGKFKTAEQLYNAYLKLEQEFTKKSQQLSDIVKKNNQNEKTDSLQLNGINNKDDISENRENKKSATNDDITLIDLRKDVNENANKIESISNSNQADVASEDGKPVFLKENFSETIRDFIKNKPIAKDFFKEIGKEILNNDALKNNENCLNEAYHTVLEEKYKNLDTALKDEQSIMNIIENNPAIKSKIINDYLDSIKKEFRPQSIGKSGIYNISSPNKPRTISEAGLQLIEILK